MWIIVSMVLPAVVEKAVDLITNGHERGQFRAWTDPSSCDHDDGLASAASL